jgi:hypothetical protein
MLAKADGGRLRCVLPTRARPPDRFDTDHLSEVESCNDVNELTFTADDVLDRVRQHGDLLTHLHDTTAPRPAR